MFESKYLKRLVDARIERHISQTKLAGMLGVNMSTLWKWEQGWNQPRVDLFFSWCKILNVEL